MGVRTHMCMHVCVCMVGEASKKVREQINTGGTQGVFVTSSPVTNHTQKHLFESRLRRISKHYEIVFFKLVLMGPQDGLAWKSTSGEDFRCEFRSQDP